MVPVPTTNSLLLENYPLYSKESYSTHKGGLQVQRDPLRETDESEPHPPEAKKKGVVYRTPCEDFGSYYDGETGRNLQKRITEYKSAVGRGDANNGIVHGLCDKAQPMS
jgi:hypothetical protein